MVEERSWQDMVPILGEAERAAIQQHDAEMWAGYPEGPMLPDAPDDGITIEPPLAVIQVYPVERVIAVIAMIALLICKWARIRLISRGVVNL